MNFTELETPSAVFDDLDEIVDVNIDIELSPVEGME